VHIILTFYFPFFPALFVVLPFFIFHFLSFRSHYGPGVDSASNRNEFQVYFLRVKGGRCVRLTTLPPSWFVVMKSGNLNFLEPSGPLQACNGTALPLLHFLFYYFGFSSCFSPKIVLYTKQLFILTCNPLSTFHNGSLKCFSPLCKIFFCI
jgi:hypothetical protein